MDWAPRASYGSIVMAEVESEHTIKRLQLRVGQPWLAAENARYPPPSIDRGAGLVIWGVVTHGSHSLGDLLMVKV